VAIILSACSAGPTKTSTSSTPAAATNATLTVDSDSYPATLDPGLQYGTGSYIVYRNIYDQLLRRDPTTNKPVPWIATKWTQTNPDSWKFTLRNNVKFTDGTPLTAADVAFSINRILDKSLNSAQYANFSMISQATAQGSTTLIIQTHSPSPTLVSFLTTLSIVSKAYVDKNGAAILNKAPMGSGPYKFESAQAGAQVTLIRNGDYWHGKPTIAKVIFRAVPNEATRVADIRSGLADLATALSPDDATQLKSAAGSTVLTVPTEFATYVLLNTIGSGSPADSAKVRQAIEHAIDRDSLMKSLLAGYAKPINAVVSPPVFGYPAGEKAISYSPSLAKKLLKESGTPHPVLNFLTQPAYNQQVVQAIQSELQAVGFTVNIHLVDSATFNSSLQSPNKTWGDAAMLSWSCGCLDADGTLSPMFHTGGGWSSYANPTVDALIDRLLEDLQHPQQ
jgi:peptide/nickel transport system substrate-binding protein